MYLYVKQQPNAAQCGAPSPAPRLYVVRFNNVYAHKQDSQERRQWVKI